MGGTPTYYKLPAGATEGNFEAVVGVTDPSELDDPENYAADLAAYLSSNDFARRAGIPTSLSSFKNDGFLRW